MKVGHVDFLGIAPVLFILNYYNVVHLFYGEFYVCRGLKMIHIMPSPYSILKQG